MEPILAGLYGGEHKVKRRRHSLKDSLVMRLFCAVEPSAETRTRVAEHIARVRRAIAYVPASVAKWESVEKIHITLKFLGEIEPDDAAEVSRAAMRAASTMSPFAISIEGAGAFPPGGLPRILWLGVTDPSGKLARLQQRLENECAERGFAREARAFHPHLTLARLRLPREAKALAQLHAATEFAAAPFTVAELVVMQSELTPTGSCYTALSRHNLDRE